MTPTMTATPTQSMTPTQVRSRRTSHRLTSALSSAHVRVDLFVSPAPSVLLTADDDVDVVAFREQHRHFNIKPQ